MDVTNTIDRYLALINYTGAADPLGLTLSHNEALSAILSELRPYRLSPGANRKAVEYFWAGFRTKSSRINKTSIFPTMPPKRKVPFSTGGFAKRSRTTTKYGGTGKKYADKYGGKGMDAILYEAERLANSAAKKQALKVSETLRSQSGFTLKADNTTFTQTGFALSGLNQSAVFQVTDVGTRGNATNQCFVFPLSPMSQLGNSGTAGYRTGQKINVHGLDVSIAHYQGLASVVGIYHLALIRNVSQTISGPLFASPGITQTNALGLFLPLNQGPLANQGGPSGTLPNGDYSTIMQWNRGDWRCVKHTTYTMPALTQRENTRLSSDPGTVAGTQICNVSKLTKFHYDFKDQVWDYSVPTQTNGIKGGDYYFIMWREGVKDFAPGMDNIIGTVQLTYKDP